MSGEAGPFLFHTGNPTEVPYILSSVVEKHGTEFISKNIWINLYDRLCNRIFVPSGSKTADTSELLSAFGISQVITGFWPLYEEYGLHQAVPYGNATALHVRPSSYVQSSISHAVTMSCFHRSCQLNKVQSREHMSPLFYTSPSTRTALCHAASF